MEGRVEGQAGACLSLVVVLLMQSRPLILAKDLEWHLLLQLLLALLLADMLGCLLHCPEGLPLVAPCMHLMLDQAEGSQPLQGRGRIQQQGQLHIVPRAMLILLGMEAGVAEATLHMHTVTWVVTGVTWVLLLVVVAVAVMVRTELQALKISYRVVQAGESIPGQMLLLTRQL